MTFVRSIGLKAEDYFLTKLSEKEIPYDYVNEWYDFLINKKHKVEVKSCQLTIRHTTDYGWRIGRFDFTNEENREQQYKENIWICLIIRHQDQFLFYGFLKAKEIWNKRMNKKLSRYLTIHKARSLKPITFNEWISRVKDQA